MTFARIPDEILFADVEPCDHDTKGPNQSCSQCGLPGPDEDAGVAWTRWIEAHPLPF